MGDWHQDLFDDRYLVYFEDALLAGASAEEIEFIDRALALNEGDLLLDLGCGFGRHAIPLALRGYRVTGVDRSASMLSAAQRLAAELGADVSWLARDMRQLHELAPFDACVCLYTAFGYFSDEENAQVLASVRDVLRPGGTLLLDVDNPLSLVPRLPREHWSRTRRGVRRERHEYDAIGGRLLSARTLITGPESEMRLPTSSVRLYPPHELRRLLLEAGFDVEQVHGGLRGTPFDWRHSAMQSWVARRR